MGGRKISGLNDRFGPERYKGYEGTKGADEFPYQDIQTCTLLGAAATYDSPAAIPLNAVVYEVVIIVTVLFDGVPTLIVGTTGDTDLVVTLADAVDLTATGTTTITREIAWTLASVARATVGGAPTVGAGTVQVRYQV